MLKSPNHATGYVCIGYPFAECAQADVVDIAQVAENTMNAIRVTYLSLFFANAIFAALFKALGEDTLKRFGTFDECDAVKNASCRGNQMIFRASFSIAAFFLVHTVLSFCYQPKQRCCAYLVLAIVEFPVYIGMLVGSFFIPSSFVDGYAHFSRVVSGFFILFQIVSIVDFAYQLRDGLLDRIEKSDIHQQEKPGRASTLWAMFWKGAFLGLCFLALLGAGIGVGYLYHKYRSCGVGVAFTTITVIFGFVFLALCISRWLDVGLLPPCVVVVYLVLMCWQALTSNPNKSCEVGYVASDGRESPNVIAYSAIIGAFSMTWTSWRTSSAASTMFKKSESNTAAAARRKSTRPQSATSKIEFSGAAVGQLNDIPLDAPPKATSPGESPTEPGDMLPEPWQFYMMMFLGSVYMAMVLTDWASASNSSNGVSMWVKIAAQWLTILLFLWTLLAPKLFPDRDFTGSS